MIDTPQPGENDDQPKSDLEKVRANPETTDTTPPDGEEKKPEQDRHYAKDVVSMLKAAGGGIVAFVNWTDEKDGFITALATVVIAVLTIFYVHYSRAQWQAMRDQLPELRMSAKAAKDANDIAAKQFETSQRPWVDADIRINGPLTFSVNGASLPVIFTLRNSGHSPAFGTFVNPRIVIKLGGSDLATARNQACSDAKRATSMTLGITIFPDIKFQQPEDVGISKQDIEKAVAQFPTFKGNFVGPTLVACISYRPTFNNTSVYTTAYIAQLFKVASPNQVNAAFKPGENIDAAHLLLRFSPMNAIEAN